MFADENSDEEPTCCNHVCCAHCGYKIPYEYEDIRRKRDWSYDCEGEKVYRKDLEILIESCCPKDKRTLEGLIEQCLVYNGLEALEDLPSLGYRVSPMNDEKQTIIHLAFYKKAHDALNYNQGSILFTYEKDHTNYVDCYGLSHLHVACVTGDTDVVREFLDKSENVNAQFHSDPEGSRTNFTALHFAAANEYVAIAELLLRRGADINATDIHGRTSLHLACCDTETIGRRAQGDKPFDFDRQSNRQKTISELAIVELLLNYGGDPNAGDEQGNTPLFYCFQKFNVDKTGMDSRKDKRIVDLKSRQRKIFELLLKHGADVTVVNNDNENILHWIMKDLQFLRLPLVYENVSFNDIPYVELIEKIFALDQEMDVNATSSNDEFPLQLALSLMSGEVVKVLLKYNADLNKLNQKKPIHFVYPNIPLNLEAVQNMLSMIEILSDKEYSFSLEDNIIIMKLLVHNCENCHCALVKGDENIECIIVNALYYGSLAHLDSVGKKFGETSKSSSWRSYDSYNRSKSDKLQEYTYYYLDCKKKLGLFDRRQNILKKLKNKQYSDYKFNKLVENLDSEVVKMKSTLLKHGMNENSTTLYNIMKRHYSTIYHYIKGKDIQKLVTDFPSYEKLIKGHVAKSLTRHYLENSASNYLKLLSPTLADVCCKMIIFYLSNEDILNVSIAVLPSSLSP